MPSQGSLTDGGGSLSSPFITQGIPSLEHSRPTAASSCPLLPSFHLAGSDHRVAPCGHQEAAPLEPSFATGPHLS